MVDSGLTFEFSAITLGWWLFLGMSGLVIQRLVGYARINTFSIFLPLVLITQGALVPFTFDVNPALTGISIAPEAFKRYWFGLVLMYLALPCGVVVANYFYRGRGQSEISVVRLPRNNARATAYVLLVAVLCFVSLAQIYALGIQLDLGSYVRGYGSYDDYAAHRYPFAQATTGLAFYFYNKLPYALAPLAVIIVANHEKWSFRAKTAFLCLVAFTVVQSGHKMPLLAVAAFIVASRFAIRHNLRLTKRFRLLMVALSIAITGLLLPLFYLNQGQDAYDTALFWSAERLLIEPSRTLQLYFQIYPDEHPYLYGRSLQTVALLTGRTEYLSASQYIPNIALGIPNTSYPSLFIGEAWADFGYVGVVMESILVGLLLQLYNRWFYSQRIRSLDETALFLAVTFSTVHLLSAGLGASLLTYGLGTSLLIFWFLRFRGRASRTVAALRPVAH